MSVVSTHLQRGDSGQNSTRRFVRAHGLAPTLVHATAVALACLISFEIATHLLARVSSTSHEDAELGGMWASIATLFVFRDARPECLRRQGQTELEITSDR
jgi:hypothetical protein